MTDRQMIAVGSYTSRQGHIPDARGSGLSIFGFDDTELPANLFMLSEVKGLENPTYLAWDPSRRLLYAACEAGRNPGRVDVFKIDSEGEGVPNRLFGSSGTGKDACHICLSNDRTGLFTASYGGGEISAFRLGRDGSPRLLDSISYEGSGPNVARQGSPHAHQVSLSPYSDHLYVCDLGSDIIWIHPASLPTFLKSGGSPKPALKLPAGYGPRHLAFDLEKPYVYILCELVPRIVVAQIDQRDGSLEMIQEIPSTAEDVVSPPLPAPAAIKIHPSGNSLVVSNRFRDTVAVFDIIHKPGTLRLDFLGEYPCGGKTPRDIEFSADGSLLMIANQVSHNLSSLWFNSADGHCSGEPGPGIETGSPACIICL